MKLVVISPEYHEPRETAVLGELFTHGLDRYHVRKPTWTSDELEDWLTALPRQWRPRLVLHQHHELVETLGLGGRHWRDDGTAPISPGRDGKLMSRSCHDLATAATALGCYDSIFFGPLFASISKPGHGPHIDVSLRDLTKWLAGRPTPSKRTSVLALGGITVKTAPQALALGFDGVAVLGAIWQAADPVREFSALRNLILHHVD